MAYVSPFEDAPVADAGQLKEASGANDNVLQRSLRGGVYGAGSNLASTGAAVLDAVGAEDAGAGLHRTSQGLREQAALPGNAPRVGSYAQLRDNFSMDNAGEYLGGLIGGSLPVTAAGIAGGMATGGAGLVPAMLGAGAATLPFNVGEVVQKQQADPQALQQGAGQRLGDAVLGGAGASAIESLVPGLVGRQVLGKGLANLGKSSFKQTVGRNAMDIPLEGLTEGAGTAVKQFAANQDKPLDWDEIKEGAIGGAAAGSAFSGVGTAADLVNSVAPSAGNALPSARTSINERLAAGKQRADETLAEAAKTPAGKKVTSVFDDISAMVGRGKEKLDDSVDRMMQGKPLGASDEDIATATPERVQEILAKSDNESVKKATEWAKSMLDDAGLDADKRQAVSDALTNAGERSGQVAMAGLKKAWDLGKAASGKIDSFASAVKQGYQQSAVQPKSNAAADRSAFMAGKVATGMSKRDASNAWEQSQVKKSEDYSGANKAIADQLAPLLERNQPALAGNQRALTTLADGLRQAVSTMPEKQLSSDAIFRLIDALGADTVPTLTKAWDTLGDPAKVEGFYKALNEITELQQRTSKLSDLVGGSLTEASQKLIHPEQFGELTNMLLKRARGEGVDPNAGPHQQQAVDTQFRQLMAEHFGDKADAVSLAVEKEAGMGKAGGEDTKVRLNDDGTEVEASEGGFDESGSRLEAAETEVMKFGLSKPDARGNSKSALNGTSMQEGSRYAKQHLLDLKAEYPEHDVRFERLPGSDQGHIVVEKRDNLGEFNAEDLAGMKLDTKEYSKSASRLEVGGHIVDATRVARVMRGKMQDKFEGDTPTNITQRLVDAFKQGVAQLTDQFGEVVNVPDGAVIGFVGGKPLTWGDAKKLDVRTDDDVTRDTNARDQEKLRAAYKTAKANGASAEVLGKLMKEYKALLDEHATVLTKDLSKGDDIQTRSRDRTAAGPRAARGNDTAVGTTRVDNGVETEIGKTMKPDKDGNIHEAGSRMKEQDLIHRSNMDGSGQWVDARGVEGLNTLVTTIAEQWSKASSAGAKAVTARAKVLVANAASMSKADLRRLKSLAPDPVKGVRVVPAASVSEAASLINELARKYKDVIVAPDPKRAGPVKPERPVGRGAIPRNPVRFYNEGKAAPDTVRGPDDFEGSAPSPKALAAKKAALIEAASSGNPALIAELKASTDAKGLQRAVMHISAEDFSTFDLALAKNGLWGKAAYFTDDTKVISKYRALMGGAPHEYKTDLALNEGNTLDATKTLGEQSPEVMNKLAKAIPRAWLDGHLSDSAEKLGVSLRGNLGDKFAESMSRLGIKAVKHNEVVEGGRGGVSYAVFDAEAIGRMEKTNADRAIDTANARLAELVQDPDVAYGLQTKKYSAEATDPKRDNSKTSSQDIKDYIERVLGKSVKLAWAKFSEFTHAGEFKRMPTGDIIRLSVHALNPLSTAYHESLHAFVAQLRDAGATDVVDVLFKAASAPHVVKYLNHLYRGQPAVLAQLKDPEERAAYMYQAWAANPKAFMISPASKTVLQKISDLIRSVLGIWSNDQRALHIMDYFNSGKYAQAMGTPNAAHRAMMGQGRNRVVEASRAFTEPLGRLADAVLSTGDARLRDTEIPALAQLADLIKRSGLAEGGDQGFIPAARVESAKRMGAMAEKLAKYSPESLQEALQALQSAQPAPTPQAQAAVAEIKAVLKATKAYMEGAGVTLGDLGPDYFPRVWDTHYVSKNEQALRDMLEPYVRSGEFKGNPTDFIRSLTSRDGNEFGVETNTPGMQFKKTRTLAFLKAEDVAPFLQKDLMGTMASYIGQATRRAEWERRLGWDKDAEETRLNLLLADAKKQGATPEQLDTAQQYLKGVDGTLGDDINPHARRIMGNMIVYQNVRLLPMAMFSMLIDPMGVKVRGGTVSEAYSTFKRGIASIPETFGRKTARDEATRLAELVGVIDSAVLNHVMGDVYTQGMVGGTAKKINNAFFKLNMVEGLNRSFRVGASEAAMSFLARHADLASSQHSKRWMAELGIEAGDIIKTADGRVALTEAEGLSAEQVQRVHAAINQWVDGAMLRPDAADKPIWMNDPHYALISHLKQFVFSFQKTILGRMMHELRHGNYTPAMALASYVPMMIAADTIKGVIQGGGDEPEWKKGWGVAEYVGHGVQRAGLLGVGQFGLDTVEDVQRGGVGLGALAGPTLEQLADAVQLLGGHKQFGPMLLDAMPANALYKESLGGASDGEPAHIK